MPLGGEVDEVEWQGGRVYLYLGAAGTIWREARRYVARIERWRPVTLIGFDAVAAA